MHVVRFLARSNLIDELSVNFHFMFDDVEVAITSHKSQFYSVPKGEDCQAAREVYCGQLEGMDYCIGRDKQCDSVVNCHNARDEIATDGMPADQVPQQLLRQFIAGTFKMEGLDQTETCQKYAPVGQELCRNSCRHQESFFGVVSWYVGKHQTVFVTLAIVLSIALFLGLLIACVYRRICRTPKPSTTRANAANAHHHLYNQYSRSSNLILPTFADPIASIMKPISPAEASLSNLQPQKLMDNASSTNSYMNKSHTDILSRMSSPSMRSQTGAFTAPFYNNPSERKLKVKNRSTRSGSVNQALLLQWPASAAAATEENKSTYILVWYRGNREICTILYYSHPFFSPLLSADSSYWVGITGS
ncbi:hypothetical protein Ciccas_010037 [Cichlidogyrus casuarinus]|uniref:Uncharacterized protein n=1 Tax=Cichlidogyrus casuarinus TaxID=1844966 RepID=A0ABD2PV97_9PLAT